MLFTFPSLKANVVHHTSQNLNMLLMHNLTMLLSFMYAPLIMLCHMDLVRALRRVLECYCIAAFLASDCQVEGEAVMGEGAFVCG